MCSRILYSDSVWLSSKHSKNYFSVCSVPEEDKHLPSPFTQAPTASLIMERERQAKERAPAPGSSKLSRYRGRSQPSNEKVDCSSR